MNKNIKKYDVIVVGAGPAGVTAALFAKKQGRSVLLLDKATFPREKICGDGLSTRAILTLKDLGLYEKFLGECPVNKIDGVIFSSPNGATLPINYAKMGRTKDVEGYTLNRIFFDNFMINEAKNEGIDVWENFEANKFILNSKNEVCGIYAFQTKTKKEFSFEAKIVVCACGIFPKILKSINYKYPSAKKNVIGIKQYFKEVECDEKMIEMHFIKSIVEGYLWIFPEKDDVVNVGFIIPEKIRRKRRINLKKELRNIILSPHFADRFKFAKEITKPKAAFLNLGGTKVFKPKGGLIIVGDAMGLTEHFTGEGVGNAMFSAQKAAQVINSAFESDDFSAKKMAMFHKICVKVLLKEFRVSAIVNKMKCVWLIDFVVGVATKNGETMIKIAKAVASQKDRKRLLNPLFYINLLFKK
ncbi:MAG: geranylgeranyl reductase family protein [Chitinivibrionia bacterium]|nr:geranylgeranyl reductase family protein [Chitinivibrionia bacterium]